MSNEQNNFVNDYDAPRGRMPSTSNIASLNLNRTTPYPRPLPPRDSKIARRNRLSVRATKRVIAPYVKARQRPIATIKKREENKFFAFYLKKKPSILMSDLSKFLADCVDLLAVLNETGDVLKESIQASGAMVYMVDEALDEIYMVPHTVQNERHRICWKIQPGSTVAAYAAYQKEYIMIEDILEDERFPDALGHADLSAKSVLCVPIVTPDDECLAVIELFRTTEHPPFDERHLRLVIVMSGWIGSAIFQNQQRIALQRQHELNEYLLDLTRCYFADTMLLDKLITEMVNFAKTSLNAEHGSFYVIKKKFDEVYADCYEEGITDETGALHKKNILIKMDKEHDIAGRVAHDGLTVNIKNVAMDEKIFHQNKEESYIIRSVLCMPIMGVDEILGIIQVVNKKRGAYFSKTDEILFHTFSIYCAFALHYNKMYEKMLKTTNLNDIYVDMLQFHMKPCIHDYNDLLSSYDIETLPPKFNNFDWYISDGQDQYMPHLAMFMFIDLAKDSFTDISQMVKFILTVKKSYHNHPYHNFKHAFNVLHCIYNVLKRNLDMFNEIEIHALLIAAICHDIDHLGVTNNFLEITNHNLAQLYDGSVLENHHYHVTMFIVKDLQLFTTPMYSVKSYKRMVTELREAILATDLSLYFKKRSVLHQIWTESQFDWEMNEHRSLCKAIIMTTADLSGQCKPFIIVKKITDTVYQEFYSEGDREKSMGLCPLSIMDREKQNMIPSDQIQFLTIVVLPCTLLLSKLLPNCIQLYQEALALRDSWQEVLDTQGVKIWKQESVTDATKNDD